MQLFETEKKTDRYTIVYNLTPIAEGLFVPVAYIVQRDRNGKLSHIQKKAIPKTIQSYGIDSTPTIEKLFEIIEKLDTKALEEKFKPPRKRFVPFQKLWGDNPIQAKIRNYVHQELDTFLSEISEQKLLICWNIERKVSASEVLMEIPKQKELTPQIQVDLREKVIHYYLRLEDENGVFDIRTKDVIPITNTPAWLFVDYKLYKVPNINGNMVKPFRKKWKVVILLKNAKMYFESFILKQASKLDIEANGFEVLKNDQLLSAELQATENVFTKKWGLNLKFQYADATFHWNEKRRKVTNLRFESEEEITILQTVRNDNRETSFLNILKNLGLEISENNLFQIANTEADGHQIFEWIRTHQKQLEAFGFQIVGPRYDQKPINLHTPKITQEISKKNDWFDLLIVVQVGQFSIPFHKLIPYIREGNRFYLLPDDTWFLIPEEWMTKYLALAQFGKRDKDLVRLSKSQFTILNKMGFESKSVGEIDWKNIDFTLSTDLKATLRPYQLEGVKWLFWNYQNDLGACLADDMGLGKTLQMIAILLHAKEQRVQNSAVQKNQNVQTNLFNTSGDIDYLKPLNALVILPASLVFNWESEIKKFAPKLNVYRHVGTKRHKDIRILERFDVLLTTYQTALKDAEILKEMEFEYIVLDESQYIKNKDSKVFKAINQFQANNKVSLSGTPIENSLSDLWSQMQFINPGLLGSYAFFKREFISPIERGGDDMKKEQLRNMVSPFLLRRTKEQVAKDLPELDVQVYYSEMTSDQKKLYEKEKSKARNFLLENFNKSNFEYNRIVIQTLLKLRQIVNHPRLVFEDYEKESGKFKDVLEQWETVNKSNHKALIFSTFVKYLDLFKTHFSENEQEFSWLTGSVTQKQRAKEIEKFQTKDSVKSFLISTKAGGTGLNLTAADYVFMLDPWWNPAAEKQAIARAHRIGQTKKVFALKFITKDSIEEKILKLQERKATLAEDILSGAGKQSLSRGDLEFLLG
ncbi:MAG: SNF2-related protein [Bacteroidetes bacterium]|nr:SNF2-related protein [Bacteroidota bacterium]